MNSIHRTRTERIRLVPSVLVVIAMGLVIGSYSVAAVPLLQGTTEADAQNPQDAASAKLTRRSLKYESVALRGKVVEIGPYLLQEFRIPMDDDVGKSIVALVTDSGEVHPLVKDVRSRGFWMDKRLRDRPMELHVHKFHGLPFVRVIDSYSVKGGKKFAVDYWCTVCAITTFEPGPCPCCQDEIELRERPVNAAMPGNP